MRDSLCLLESADGGGHSPFRPLNICPGNDGGYDYFMLPSTWPDTQTMVNLAEYSWLNADRWDSLDVFGRRNISTYGIDAVDRAHVILTLFRQ